MESKTWKKGKSYHFGSLRFWAEGGAICLEDLSDETEEGRFRVVMCEDFKARMETLKRGLQLHLHVYGDERNAERRCVEDAEACVREAKAQGDWTDPKVMEHIRKHYRSNVFRSGTGTATQSHLISPAEYLAVPGERPKPPLYTGVL